MSYSILGAAKHGHIKSIVHHFAKTGSDINQVDPKGENALIIAARRGHFETVKYLLELGINPLYCTATGKDAVFSSIFNGQFKMAYYLISTGLFTLNHAMNGGRNYLMTAASQPYRDETIACQKSLISLLMNGGMDINTLISSGENALFYAVCAGNAPVVSFLLEQGASMDTKNAYIPSLFDALIIYGHGDAMVTALLSHSDKMSERDWILYKKYRLKALFAS